MECTDKYDFDTPIDRTNTQSLKWDVAENELPMWVAKISDYAEIKYLRERYDKVEAEYITLIKRNGGKLCQ